MATQMKRLGRVGFRRFRQGMTAGFALVLGLAGAGKVFLVDDFGARPNSQSNARGAILKAIVAAQASGGPVEVAFGEGTYRLETEFLKKDGYFLPHALIISGARDLVVRGVKGKTKLVVTHPKNGLFRFNGCQRIRVADLIVDYDPLPFSQGRLLAIDTNRMSADVAIDEGYRELDAPYLASNLSILTSFDPAITRALVPSIAVIPLSGCERLGPGRWRVKSAGHWMKRHDSNYVGQDPIQSSYVHVGVRVILSARDSGTVLLFGNCGDVEISGICAYAAPGGFIGAMNSSNFTIRDCQDTVPAGSGRLMSTCADGIHLKNLRGPLLIEGCRLEKMGDDSINFHGTGLFVERVDGPTSTLLNGLGWSGMVLPGDELQFIDQKGGSVQTAFVRRLELSDGGRKYLVELDGPLLNLKAGDKNSGTLVFNASGCPNPFVVRGNYLASQTEILARGLHGVIENNTLVSESTLKQAIVMSAGGAPWFEGPFPRDILIRSNTFVGERWCQVQMSAASLGAIRDITLSNNRFLGGGGVTLAVSGASGIRFEHNRVDNRGASIRRGGPYSLVTLELAEKVAIDRLTVQDPDPLLTNVVRIGKRVSPGKEGCTIGEVNATLAPGVPIVSDLRTP